VKRIVDSVLPAPRHRQDNPGRRSWQITLPNTCKHKPPSIDIRRIEIVFRSERSDQSFVGSYVFQNSAKETGLARGGANLCRSNACCGQKLPKAFCVGPDERKRLNRKRLSLFLRGCRAAFHPLDLPFRKKRRKQGTSTYCSGNPLRSVP
jgi:hypothetical protein